MATLFSCTVGGVALFAMTDVQERCADVALHNAVLEVRQVVDQEAAIDADAMRLFARKAQSWSLSWEGERQHADVATALAFANSHPATVALGVGACTLVMGGGSSSYTQASVIACATRVSGSRTTTSYSVIMASRS